VINPEDPAKVLPRIRIAAADNNNQIKIQLPTGFSAAAAFLQDMLAAEANSMICLCTTLPALP
jgi:hypothetical protein